MPIKGVLQFDVLELELLGQGQGGGRQQELPEDDIWDSRAGGGSYLVPLLVGAGAMEGKRSEKWSVGYFAEVGMVIGGSWQRWWVQTVAAISNMGFFKVEMNNDLL